MFKGKKVLITGGLGFIGSNLANRLVSLGAEVTILDSLNPLYGGNLFNIEEIKDRINIKIADIRDENVLEELIPGKDYLFDFAAQVSPVDSSIDPLEDLDVNCRGHLLILEACKKLNKDTRIIFSSSRMVYGAASKNPISEDHPTNPTSIYGIHKLTAEKYYLSYYKDYGINSSVIRITNPYGIRQQIKHSKYSIPGWFMRLAMEGQPIKIFGDGSQVRDYIYIEDLIDAIILISSDKASGGEIFNIGSGTSTSLKEMVECVISAVGNGSIQHVDWPDNYKKIETGDSSMDTGRLKNKFGWGPKNSLEDGMKKMVDYYSKYKNKYLETKE